MPDKQAASVADHLRRLDQAFFQRVLRQAGFNADALTRIDIEPLAFTGAAADMARIRLSYAEPAAGPASMIAKIRGASPQRQAMEAAMGLYEREAHFYGAMANHIPLKTPRCYFIGNGDTEPLLLEDLGGLRMGNQAEGLEPADARRVMDALAALHARFWAAPEIDADWLASPSEGPFAQMICQLVASGVDKLKAQFGDQVPAAAIDAVTALAPRWQSVLDCGSRGPQTLIHNDCRLDNLFFDHDGQPVFVDWQLPARCRASQDVGNLLAGSMDADVLSRHWQDLLQQYHQQLCAHGVNDYSWDDCQLHYRQSILYPLGAGIALMGDLDIGDTRGVTQAMVLRPLRHCFELESFATV